MFFSSGSVAKCFTIQPEKLFSPMRASLMFSLLEPNFLLTKCLMVNSCLADDVTTVLQFLKKISEGVVEQRHCVKCMFIKQDQLQVYWKSVTWSQCESQSSHTFEHKK